MVGELGSVVSTYVNNRSILGWIPSKLFVDCLPLVFLLKLRFSANVAIDNPIVRRCLIALQPYNFIAHYLPGSAMTKTADALSRFKGERGVSVSQFLHNTDQMERFETVDHFLREERGEEDLESFLDTP